VWLGLFACLWYLSVSRSTRLFHGRSPEDAAVLTLSCDEVGLVLSSGGTAASWDLFRFFHHTSFPEEFGEVANVVAGNSIFDGFP
jgi:hypothetical protein